MFSITEEVLKLRPFALAFIARGRKIGANLDHLIEYQERLHSTIGKDRKKVSIGIHDLSSISPPFTFDSAKSRKTRFTTYDDLVTGTAEEIIEKHPKVAEYSHLILGGEKVRLLTVSEGDVLSLPPVINGVKSKVTENTSDFFIDITGTDFNSVRNALYLLSYEMSYLGYIISYPDFSSNVNPDMEKAMKYDGRKISLARNEVEKILGFGASDDEVILQLRKMGYMAEVSSSGFDVYVPGNRIDVMGQVDVIEDIAKGLDFSVFPEKELNLPMAGIPDSMSESLQIMKDILIGAGIQEVRSFVVTSASMYSHSSYRGGVELLNPKSLDFSVVRDRLYLNLLEFLRINQRRPLPQKIFEIGSVVEDGRQLEKLCVMIHGSKASYSMAKQVIDYFALRMGGGSVRVEDEKQEGIIPGRGGSIFLGSKKAGIIGEIDPELITESDLKNPVAFFEISLEKMNF